MLAPDELTPLNPDQFRSIFANAMAASMGEIEALNPEAFSLAFQENHGSISEIQLTDIPINRMAVSIRQEYGADPEMFQNIMMRLFALMNILQNQQVRDVVTKEGEEEYVMVHPAAIDVTATLPLNQAFHFDLDVFLREVAELAKTKYVDLE